MSQNFRYLSIAVLHIFTLVYLGLSFGYDEEITGSPKLLRIISIILGFLLETSNYIYSCWLPLKIAKAIT